MRAGLWAEPVTFETLTLGVYRTISSASEAAGILLYHWPTDEGPAFKAAQEICLAALEGKVDPEESRHAFLLAADEAGVFIRD
ncbi:hypothetical protein B5M44_04015 [Shinella sumterensis]|uniref:DUF982 domain-containing protein n=1 Tax=Shinella sumterensis TaxID=1967501 RepID=UPI00106DFFA9|nr:DUF982 domain-containing protein [Shinella sumterensis]MCD1264091.1 DUF982 domain-containing protein [Shinella sumterensis]TFE99378.1 hypothetical protein B5M44_04015 [Shinella sumterensis]